MCGSGGSSGTRSAPEPDWYPSAASGGGSGSIVDRCCKGTQMLSGRHQPLVDVISTPACNYTGKPGGCGSGGRAGCQPAGGLAVRSPAPPAANAKVSLGNILNPKVQKRSI